jgi:hypothetical protein
LNSIAYEVRVKELSRMSKRALAHIWNLHHPNAWTAHPVESWNRDELVNDILRVEFPDGSVLSQAMTS